MNSKIIINLSAIVVADVSPMNFSFIFSSDLQLGRIASYTSACIATAEMSVRLPVRHALRGIVSKRTKLASWCLHRQRARRLLVFVDMLVSSRSSKGVTLSEGV